MDTSPEIQQQVRTAKALAQANRHRRNMTLLTGVLVGLASAFVAVGLGVGSGFDLQKTVAISVALGIFLACLRIYWRSSRQGAPLAACPVCGHDWEIKEGRYVQTKDVMTHWKHCPGCNTPMVDSAAQDAPVPQKNS